MTDIKKLTLPLSGDTIKSLNAGDIVSLSGVIYTARDAAHKRMTDALKNGETLPFSLIRAAIYYAGPTPAKDGEIIGSCGPTTSARMDDYTPTLLDNGLAVMIGKGKRSDAVVESMKKNGAVYFVAVGGAAALVKNCVKDCSVVAYPDLGCEAVHRLYVENFELLVGTDCRGNSVLK